MQKEVDHNVSSWNYVVEDKMRQSKKCSGDIKRNGVLQGFRDKFGERFSGILHTALLMPRTSSIVYVGMQDVKPLFENLSMVLGDRLVDCKAKIQWSFASSVEEYVSDAFHGRISLLILDTDCTSNTLTEFSYLLEHGGMVFVHDKYKESCSALVNNHGPMDAGYHMYVKPVTNSRFDDTWNLLMASSVITMDLEGWKTSFHAMGHVGEVRAEIQVLQNLVRGKTDETHICVVGFNSGHSSISLMAANPHIKLTAFDLGTLPWSSAMMERVNALFPGRFSYIKGNSVETLPEYSTRVQQGSAPYCELMFVDRDHSYDGARKDFLNSIEIIKDGGILVANDYSENFPGVKDAWAEVESQKIFAITKKQQLQESYNGYKKGWAVGKITKSPKLEHDLQREIHVATTQCGPDVRLLKTLLKSILISADFNDYIVLHLIQEEISETDLAYIRELWELSGMEIRTYPPSLESKGISLFARCSMERLSIPQLINEEFIIYLDRDTLVMGSLWSLYDIRVKVTNKALAAVSEGPGWYTMSHGEEKAGETYVPSSGINSGVLLMNLDFMRQNMITDAVLEVIGHANNTQLGDQDLLNFYFADKVDMILRLPCRYNLRIVRNHQECTCVDIGEDEEFLDCLNTNNVGDAIILHGSREVFLDNKHIFSRIWNIFTSTDIEMYLME